MTDLLTYAIDAVRTLSDEEQDAIARQMLAFANVRGEVETMDPADEAAVLEGLDQVRRGEFATDEEVEAAFRSFG